MSQVNRPSSAPKRRRRLYFIASVRFTDGHRDCFSVDNACDHNDARRMVLEELEDVAAVLVTTRDSRQLY